MDQIHATATLPNETVPEVDRATTPSPVSAELYHLIFEQAAESIFVLDRDGRFIDLNRQACQLLGYSRAELLALTVSELVPITDFINQPSHREALNSGHFVQSQRQLRCKDGVLVPVEIRSQQLSNGCLLAIVQDLTARSMHEAVLQDDMEWLRLAHEAAELGNWRLHLQTRKVYLDPRACQHYGIATDVVDLDELLKQVDPLDRIHLQQQFATMLDPQGPTRQYMQHRPRHPDGTLRWFALRASVYFEGEGATRQPVLVTGISQDITAQKQLEAQLQTHNQQLALLSELCNLLAQSGHDYEALPTVAVRTIANAFNGGCLLRLLSPNGEWLEAKAIFDPDPEVMALLQATLATMPVRAEEHSLSRQILHSGKPFFMPTFDVASLRSVAAPAFLPLLDRLHFQSFVAAPLQVRGQAIGIIYLWRTQEDATLFNEQDLQLLQDVADRTALAIGNAQLYADLQTELIQRRQAEQALRESEQRYRTLISALPVALYTTDAQGYLTLYNDAAANLWGRDAVLGHDRWCGGWQLQRNGQPLPHDQCTMAIALQTDRAIPGEEAVVIRPDQRRVFIAAYPTPLHDEEGKLIGGLNVLVDLTARKQAEAALREMAENMAAAQRIAHFGSWEVELNEQLAFIEPHLWSAECYRIFGFAPDTAITTARFRECIHPDDIGVMQAVVWSDLQSGRSGTYTHRIILPDGTIRHIQQQVTVIMDEEHKRPIKLIGTAHDITERKTIEDALHTEQARLAQIAASVPGVIFVFHLATDDTASIPYCSSGIYDIFGVNPADVSADATPIFATVPADDLAQVFALLHASRQTMTPTYLEFRSQHPTKGELWVAIHASPVREADGSFLWYGFGADITERKRIQEELHYQADLLANVNDAVIATDLDRCITSWNKGAEQLYGWQAAEAIGHPLNKLIHHAPPDTHPFPNLFQYLVANEAWRGESTHRRKDGAYLQTLVTISLVKDTSGKVVGSVGVMRDITEQKAAEARLQIALTAAHMGVWELDVRSSQIYWSPECYQIFGGTEPVLVQADFVTFLHPEDRDWAQENFAQALTTQQLYTDEFRIVRADGEVRWVSNLGQATYNEQGEPLRVIGTVQDITARKNAEMERAQLEEQFHQSQKMETIGRLAGGVAHDFNNLLTVIQGYSDMLLSKVGTESPLFSKLDQISRAGKRAADLTSQLLAFSRRQMLTPSVVDLNHVITDLQRMLERLIGEDILLAIVLHPALWTVTVDSGRVEQVIMNLVVNARDAMPTGGVLTIESNNVILDQQTHRNHPEAPSGAYVLLAITDTGCGMDERVRAQIFEPFFTTKEQGKGTGLGLSTAYGIIKQSGGDIIVDSTPEIGSTFKVYLPATQRIPQQDDTIATEHSLMRGSETILLVEDEEMVRDLVQFSLEEVGYRVLAAASGSAALALAAAHPTPIDLVVTDVVMPQMSGRELVEQFQILYPTMKVLFTSGYTDDAVVRHGLLTAEVAFLQKPFSPHTLLTKVRALLDE